MQVVSLQTEKVNCIICGEDEFDILFTYKWKGGLFRGIEFKIVQCKICGLVYNRNRISLKKAYMLYPDPTTKGFQITMGLRADPAIRERLGFQHKYLGLYSRLSKKTKRMRVLDFLSRDGSFLDVLKEHGFSDLYGIEIRPVLAKMALRKGYKVMLGSIEQTSYTKFPDNFFDLIVMRHTIEHLYEPFKTLREMHRILKAGGHLRIETPNIESLSRILFGDRWTGFYIPWHLYYFSASTLAKLIMKAGFSIIKVDTLPYPHYMLSGLRYFAPVVPTHRERRIIGAKFDHSPTIGALLFPLNALACEAKRGDEIIVLGIKQSRGENWHQI